MVSQNDYRLVARKSMDAYRDAYESDVIPDSFELNEKTADIDRIRIGFYFLTLKSITGISDDKDISRMIIDTDYLSKIENKVNDDLGVDAYYINEKEGKVNLFNFKYREKWNKDSKFKGSEIYSSLRFLSFISGEKEASEILNEFKDSKHTIGVLEEIDKFRENGDVEINLYLVSNEVQPIDMKDKKFIQKTNDVTVKSVTLGSISDYLIEVKRDVSAAMKISNKNVMVYREAEESSYTSYVFSISLLELARITSKDEDFRMNFKEYGTTEVSDKECVDLLNYVDLDQSVLHDNVRGFMGITSFNYGIMETIENDPKKFFMYNNGITITAERIDYNPPSGVKRSPMSLVNYQVVNGGQTLKSVHKFIEYNIAENPGKVVSCLRSASVIIRAYPVGSNQEEGLYGKGKVYSIGTQIARFTNSQNAINPADFHSNDTVQRLLKSYLDGEEYEYVLKRDYESRKKKNGKRSVSMELVAQIIMAAIVGRPDRASNQKRKLFTEFYDDIFNELIGFDKIKELLDRYFLVMEYYESQTDEDGENLRKSVQRNLYILYIMEKTGIKDISEAEKVLDNAFAAFMPGVDIVKYRRLAYTKFKYAKFKDTVDEQIASL